MKLKLYFTFISIGLFVVACSAVPTTRYESKKPDEKTSTNQAPSEDIKPPIQKKIRTLLNEDYDISIFSPQLSVQQDGKQSNLHSDKNIWYSFPLNSEIKNQTNPTEVIGSTDGYRVFVFSSDALEEIEEIKLKVENIRGIHQLYLQFEPPFYKIYLGDFIDLEEANSLRRKLIQLDFKEAKVVRTAINVFK